MWCQWQDKRKLGKIFGATTFFGGLVGTHLTHIHSTHTAAHAMQHTPTRMYARTIHSVRNLPRNSVGRQGRNLHGCMGDPGHHIPAAAADPSGPHPTERGATSRRPLPTCLAFASHIHNIMHACTPMNEGLRSYSRFTLRRGCTCFRFGSEIIIPRWDFQVRAFTFHTISVSGIISPRN